MPVYMDLVIILNFFVDFLLLLGTNRLCGHPPAPKRTVAAAALGSLYASICLLPGFTFLGNVFWRIVSLALMSLLAFGFSINALRRGVVFALLSMALGGIAVGVGTGGFWGIILPAACLLVMCRVGFSGRVGSKKLVQIEFGDYGHKVRCTALHDTGNTLKDPLTGMPVLVVAAEIANELTGLTKEQLQSPVETVAAVPGLRLIPYRSVGTESSFLLARRFSNVRIGSWQGSSLVAFAPERLSVDGEYQALTGGTV